jgi:hypothetical protein
MARRYRRALIAKRHGHCCHVRFVQPIIIEIVGWVSTALFLVSILVPQRVHLHLLGVFAALTTGVYAFAHGATAIWVKWGIALVFHLYMCRKMYLQQRHEGASQLL